VMEIEPQALAGMMNGHEKKPFFIDCRETRGHEIARIEGATLIPMRQVPQNLERHSGGLLPSRNEEPERGRLVETARY
jgi:rhodanese-related sulfurtransferase